MFSSYRKTKCGWWGGVVVTGRVETVEFATHQHRTVVVALESPPSSSPSSQPPSPNPLRLVVLGNLVKLCGCAPYVLRITSTIMLFHHHQLQHENMGTCEHENTRIPRLTLLIFSLSTHLHHHRPLHRLFRYLFIFTANCNITWLYRYVELYVT